MFHGAKGNKAQDVRATGPQTGGLLAKHGAVDKVYIKTPIDKIDIKEHGDIRMMTNSENKQIKFPMITIENLCAGKSLLTKTESIIDFSFIREETKAFYCHNNGRPCIDPVVLVKYLLIGFLWHRIRAPFRAGNSGKHAYRWFLGLDLTSVFRPLHLSQNRAGGFAQRSCTELCFCIVRQCMEKGLVWETDRKPIPPMSKRMPSASLNML